MVIIYALFGIPLNGIVLTKLGELFSSTVSKYFQHEWSLTSMKLLFPWTRNGAVSCPLFLSLFLVILFLGLSLLLFSDRHVIINVGTSTREKFFFIHRILLPTFDFIQQTSDWVQF